MIRERAGSAFRDADAILAGHPGAAEARRLIAEAGGRFTERLRVALAGRVSSGKSTLTNALLGTELAPTGALELTFNVSHFRYGDEPSLTVHFQDGTEPRRSDLDELARMAVRASDHDPAMRDLLNRVDHLEIAQPIPALLDFDLVDTPGLDSSLRGDSANALRWLGRSAEEVGDLSDRHASQADALILVFDRGLASSDAELLDDFTGSGLSASGPVTTVGALTKVEFYWPRHDDPLAEGRRVAESLMSDAGADRLLFQLRPLASLVAAGAGLLTPEQHADLVSLATVPPETLRKYLRRAPHFASRELDGVTVPAQRRATLAARFAPFGIWLACGLIREGCADPTELRRELLDRSGLTAFRELLLGHFAARADVIKLDRAIQEVRLLPAPPPPDDGGRQDTINRAVAVITALAHQEHAFQELTVLRDHYAGRLTFSAAETAEILRVLGEEGSSPAERLGLPADSKPDALSARAIDRLDHWAALEQEHAHSGPSRTAIPVVRRTYEILLDEVSGDDA